MTNLELVPDIESTGKHSNVHLANEIAKFDDPVLQEVADKLSFQVRKQKIS